MSYPDRDPERTRALPQQERYADPAQPVRHDEQYVAAPDQEVVRERVEDSHAQRHRTIRMITSAVTFLTGLFAVVLLAQIILTVAEANPGNGFASFVEGFSSAVSLGFDGLFSPGSAKLATVLDYGLAAIVWLLIGAAINFLIRRFASPGPRREVRYRRSVE
ncbi:hypothetical protein ACOBQX_12040 [Actinokineospora sp. G85]|uniref:hypothetical protein n=1 Tax=Actinokineospora sp. G85 TaxID=3406626 RepID=UPI003C761FCE